MYQIDWGAKLFATFFSFQLFAMAIMPMVSAAETKSISLEEDTPEEVLRAEIYTDARSPIDGTKLTSAEYVELMEKLRSLDNIPPEDFVSPKIREIINLLKLRKFFRQFIPFIF
jgi:hypothetical protein